MFQFIVHDVTVITIPKNYFKKSNTQWSMRPHQQQQLASRNRRKVAIKEEYLAEMAKFKKGFFLVEKTLLTNANFSVKKFLL